MFFFSVGTVPLMFGLGSIVSALGQRFTKIVMTRGAILVVVLGLAMLTQGGRLSGILFSDRKVVSDTIENSSETVDVVEDIQLINSTLSPREYPNITVKEGE